jgi:hypothetical protein
MSSPEKKHRKQKKAHRKHKKSSKRHGHKHVQVVKLAGGMAPAGASSSAGGGGGGSGGAGSVAVLPPAPTGLSPQQPMAGPTGVVPSAPGPVGIAAPPMFDAALFGQNLEQTLEEHRQATGGELRSAFEERLSSQEAYLQHALDRLEQGAAQPPDMRRFEDAMERHMGQQRELVLEAMRAIHEKIPEKKKRRRSPR